TIQADVRIISATNQDLRQRVDAGLFREDLYFRLVIIPLHIPPLRERVEDVPQLVEAILQRVQNRHGRGEMRISPEAIAALQSYRWPGNVRELDNLLEQLYILNDGDEICAKDLPNYVRPNQDEPPAISHLGDKSLPEIMDDAEKRL